MRRRTKLINNGVFLIILAFLFFRTNIIFGKTLLKTWDPMILMFAFTFCSTTILVFSMNLSHKIKKIFKLPGKEILGIIGVSILSSAVAPVLFLYGLKWTSATNVVFLLNTEYLIEIFLAVFLLKERLTIPAIIGSLPLLFGVYYLTTNGFTKSFEFLSGDSYVIAASIVWALSTISFKKFVHEKHIDILLTINYFISFTVLTLFIYIFRSDLFLTLHEPIPVLPFLGYVFLAMLIPFALYYYALGKTPASIVALASMCSPLIGTLYAIVFLNETLTTTHYIAGTLIICGLVIINTHFPKRFPHLVRIRQKLRQHR